MDDLLKLFSTFIGAVSLIMALVLMVSIMHRKDGEHIKNSFVMGSLFSFALFVSMSDPIDLGAGGIHDMRGLLIGTSTALLGPIVGGMTLVSGLLMRAYLGGNGMFAGFIAMGGAFIGGMLWRHVVKDMVLSQWKKSVLLGTFASFQLVGLFFLPPALWGQLFTQLAPYYFIANVIGALLINFLIGGELSFLSEAETALKNAKTDHLTGLLNRRGLEKIYPDLNEPGQGERGRALLYFDIDCFKRINDTHGHSVGDAVLRYVTAEVASNLRPNDVFARLGGDEFAVVLSRIDPAEAERIAQRCCAVVASGGFKHDGKILPVSISVGAIWMLDHAEMEAVLSEADQALYRAKSSGRNKVIFKAGFKAIAPVPLAIPA